MVTNRELIQRAKAYVAELYNTPDCDPDIRTAAENCWVNGAEWGLNHANTLNLEGIEDEFREVLGRIDFVKIKNVMDYLDWTWVSTEGEVPGVYDMVKLCENLFDSCMKDIYMEENTFAVVESGGFRVAIYPGEDVVVQVSFQLTSAETFF